jgi:hypothetical protein
VGEQRPPQRYAALAAIELTGASPQSQGAALVRGGYNRRWGFLTRARKPSKRFSLARRQWFG